ncbi:MAG: class I SAM-dependent methyltransferase [Clostridiales bacterium]|jgi:SAM-dependent methyltransferase|nr:class I SAM-dependent methyltransferase [Clostridiales bacterium]
MAQYSGLSGIYDQLMAGIDYRDWADYIEILVHKHGGVPEQSALDLACGTGNTTVALAEKGYIVTGLDLAEKMLEIAHQKVKKLPITLRQDDMRIFTLPQQVGLVTAFQDGLNYLLSEDDLRQTFLTVSRTLLPEGLFIFDINCVNKLPASGSDVAYVETDKFTLIWETSFVTESVWEISVTGFISQGEGLYRRFQEVHRERVITEQEVEAALHAAGMGLLGRYDAFSLNEPKEATRRVFYVARGGEQR